MNKKEFLFLTLLLVISALVRLLNLELTQFITYDQSRDFLIIKRLIVDHKFTLVGPTVLIPGVYLPPFYYYLLAPFLFIFEFEPLGADIFTAFLGIAAVFIFYIFSREIFGKIPTYFGSLLFAVSPIIVSFSRHAWNPNTSHFFSLVIIFSLYQFLKKHKWLWFYNACAFFSLSLNFHLSNLALLPVLFLTMLYVIRKSKTKIKNIIFSLFPLAIFISPLLFFEFRHSFSITSNIYQFLFGSKGNDPSFFANLSIFFTDFIRVPWFLLFGHLIRGVDAVDPSSIILMDHLNFFKTNSSLWEIFYQSWIVLVILLVFAGLILNLWTKNDKSGLNLIISWFLFGISLRFILPSKSFYFYQYNFLFPAIFLILVNLFSLFGKKKFGFLISLIIFLPIFTFSIINFFTLSPSSRSASYFLPAAEIISNDYKINPPVYYVVAANNKDVKRWDHNALEYRYFLESYYKMPISNWEMVDYQQAKVLYLIDEEVSKEPLKLGGMEMETFNPKKIEKIWTTQNGQTVYKMTK